MWEMKELSLQNVDVRNQIRTMIIEGKSNVQIQEILGIPKGTWDANYYRDTHEFRDFLLDCHDERLRMIARKNIDDIINMKVDESDPRYLKIKSDMTTFVAERVDKDRFGKKNEEENDNRAPIMIQLNTYEKIKKLKEGSK